MTCAEFDRRFDAWVDGTLTEVEARAVEAHAGDCARCTARLDAAIRMPALPAEIAPPAALREATLRAVVRQRTMRRWRRSGVAVAAVAAIVVLAIMGRPARKSASDFPGAGTELLARDHARPAMTALDAAERDVQTALRDHPDDRELNADLTRIRRQRAELQRLVVQARS